MSGLGDRARKAAFEHVKQKAARDIITGIKEWRSNNISTAKRRWIFELLQNAIDTSIARKNNNLKISISEKDNNLIFRHNGGYFTLDEISAVIYGGSTKPYSQESEYIGRFGTGLLVTHILSRKIKLIGFIKDNEKIHKFEMDLNREMDSEESVSENIDKCFEQLNKSEPMNCNDIELYTEFIYYLRDELGKEALNVGIEEFKGTISFILSFNSLIKEIAMNGVTFKSENIQSTNYFIETEKGETDDVVVGIAIKDCKIMSLEKLPKIYVGGLPLVETSDYINIPFVINSTNYEPTKERDALINNQQNKELTCKAFEIYKKLLERLAQQENIEDFFRTVEVKFVSDEKTSQNPFWDDFNKNIKTLFTYIIEKIPIVKTFDGKKEIRNTIFPTHGIINNLEDSLRGELFSKYYNLTKIIKKNIPVENEIDYWRNIAKNLKEIRDFSTFISLYSIEDMKKEMDNFVKNKEKYPKPKIDDFARHFQIDNPKKFLCLLYEILDGLYQKNIISSSFVDYLLPDQLGCVGPLKWGNEQLFIDDNISEDFKEILKNIGWEIRNNLLDKDFAKYKIVSDYVRDRINTNNILDRVIKDKSLRPIEDDIKKEELNSKTKGWLDLFRWCVKSRNLIIGFPVFTKDGKVHEIKNLDVEELIIPFKFMNIKEEKYEEIYPDNRILHNKYFDNNADEILKDLEIYEYFIKKLPIYKQELTIGYSKLESIVVDKSDISKVEHKLETIGESISVLPFWNEVVGKISEYQTRGKLLFEFIIKYIINNDNSIVETTKVNCSCKGKSHEIIPSHWLASLKSDAWVPYKIIENNEEKIVRREATKTSIENLFTHEEITELIKSNMDKIMYLLPHFGFDELDLKIKQYSIEKNKTEDEVRKDLVKLTDILKDVPDFPDLVKRDEFREAIEKLREGLKNKAIKDENKRVGEIVEKIIAKILCNKGLNVRPIYQGGDLEIWPENEGCDGGFIEIGPYVLEVKFISGRRVHLSKAQSEMAYDKKNNYLVLVLENVDNIRERLKNMDENSIPTDIILTVENNSKVIDEIYIKLGFFPSPDEIEPDIHGYWVKKKLWENKKSIVQWINETFNVD